MKKNQIYDYLNIGKKEAAKQAILEYEKEFPYDLELFSIKATYFFMIQHYENAKRTLLDGLAINPFNIDLLYNLSLVYEQLGDYFYADKYYRKCRTMLSDKIEQKEYRELAEELEQKMDLFSDKVNELAASVTEKDSGKFLAQVEDHLRRSEDHFGFAAASDWSLSNYSYSQKPLRYDPDYYVANFFRTGYYIEDTMHYKKVEVIKMAKTEEGAPVKNLSLEKKSLVPILSKTEEPLRLEYQGREYELISHPETFAYYPFDDDIKILSENCIVGEPISMIPDLKKKKLVLTLFIDGLSQCILEKYGFQELMPNTYDFFSNSIYFTNCYATGDWTYPSIASYYSGFYPANHKMYTSSGIVTQLPEDTVVLGEMFNEAGYTAAKIDGVWRTNPDLGYIRGLKRYIYGKFCEMMGIGEVISEAVDHMELFGDTNQFLFLTFDELHDIADGYRQRPSTQIRVDLENRQLQHEEKATSAMLNRDPKKEARYLEQIKYLDRNLSMLYFYINKLFKEDEIIVTLISDHGQSYLLEKEDFHLDDKMSRVPLLVKGVSKDRILCEEYISGVDYMHIMNHVADLNADLSDKEGILPKIFGGTEERKYIISESIHPEQPYWAMLRNKDIRFLFETKNHIEYDGRVRMDEYTAILKDTNGNLLNDPRTYQECIDFIFEHMKYFRIYE